MGPANLVIDFWGDAESINDRGCSVMLGVTISILKELAKNINIYVSNDDVDKKLRREGDDIESVDWKLIAQVETEEAEGWQAVELAEPVEAKFVRVELVRNHGTTPDIPWTEINQIKLYP